MSDIKEYEDVQAKALEVHERIMIAAQMAAGNLVEMCRNLKIMRDEKLYTDLGYDTFESYSEEKAGIKARQAYNYIQAYERLPKEFLQSNANLGITKLSLLAANVPAQEIKEFAEEHDVDSMSSRELQAAIEENKKLTEQLSMFEAETRNYKDKIKSYSDRGDGLAEELDNVRAELKKYKIQADKISNDTYSADAVDQIKSDAVKQAIKDYKNKQSKKDESEINKAAEAKAEELAKEKAKKIDEEYNKKIQAIQNELSEHKQRENELTAKLKLSDSSAAQFKIYFEEAQKSLNEMLTIISNLKASNDEDAAAKFIQATKALLSSYENDEVIKCQN